MPRSFYIQGGMGLLSFRWMERHRRTVVPVLGTSAVSISLLCLVVSMICRSGALVAEWIHFTPFGIIVPTIKTQRVHLLGLMNSATKGAILILRAPTSLRTRTWSDDGHSQTSVGEPRLLYFSGSFRGVRV